MNSHQPTKNSRIALSNEHTVATARYETNLCIRRIQWAGIAQQVQRLPTAWTVWRSSPGEREISSTRPKWLWGPSSLLYNGYRVYFPWAKRPGRGVEHLPHLAPRLKKVQRYTFTPHLGLRDLFQGDLYLYKMDLNSSLNRHYFTLYFT